MTLHVGELVIYTPLAEHRHLWPAWLLRFWDDGAAERPGWSDYPKLAALVGAHDGLGTVSLLVFPPNRNPEWVNGVREGTGPNTCRSQQSLAWGELRPVETAADAVPAASTPTAEAQPAAAPVAPVQAQAVAEPPVAANSNGA